MSVFHRIDLSAASQQSCQFHQFHILVQILSILDRNVFIASQLNKSKHFIIVRRAVERAVKRHDNFMARGDRAAGDRVTDV